MAMGVADMDDYLRVHFAPRRCPVRMASLASLA
jgi:hypothetical protein